MIKYAADNNGLLVYPSGSEFDGIPNWWLNDSALRAAGYMPLIGDAEDRDGYTATPAAWHVETMAMTRVEPRQVSPGSVEMVDTEITIDASYIQVDEWAYTEAPEEPEEDSSSSAEIDFDDDDFADLPTQFTKWELIKAWEATGDIDGLLSNVGMGKQNLLVAWSSLPDEIDLKVMITQWAAMIAMASGGSGVSVENITKWLQWIKQEREKGDENE